MCYIHVVQTGGHFVFAWTVAATHLIGYSELGLIDDQANHLLDFRGKQTQPRCSREYLSDLCLAMGCKGDRLKDAVRMDPEVQLPD